MNEGNAWRVGEGERVVNETRSGSEQTRSLLASYARHIPVRSYIPVCPWKPARCTGWLPFLIDETRFPAPTPDIRRVHRHSNTRRLPGQTTFIRDFSIHAVRLSRFNIDRGNQMKIRRNFLTSEGPSVCVTGDMEWLWVSDCWRISLKWRELAFEVELGQVLVYAFECPRYGLNIDMYSRS